MIVCDAQSHGHKYEGNKSRLELVVFAKELVVEGLE